jgi:hypothetical protein
MDTPSNLGLRHFGDQVCVAVMDNLLEGMFSLLVKFVASGGL